MTFSEGLQDIQRRLGRSGYHTLREPINIESISDNILDCEIIARNDKYNILYMEAESDWRKIAKDVAESQDWPCLVMTKNGDSLIMTTVQDKMTTHPKTRHVVVQPDSEKYGLAEFVKRVKTTVEDDHVTIAKRVKNVFDGFSKYDEAIRKFGENLGDVIQDTRKLVEKKITNNKKYDAESARFVTVCKEILNDTIDQAAITGMLIQHIVTARIFAMVYDYDFYRKNGIARELERLRELLGISDDIIDYSDIKLVAESITDNKERQEFIRNIYETFYEKFDSKRADRDGIVYTPVEIIDFILNSVSYVLKSEFKTDFADESVKILEPFAGTGTFLARLLDSGMLGDRVEERYRNGMFANEMLLLAFYIATVNIESTFVDITGSDEYTPFEGMNYTDTLMMDPRYLEGGHHKQEATKIDEEFVDIRRRRQKQRKTNLHVIVGNPPYSAGQGNFNDQNQNISYPDIDKRIEGTYLQMTKTINPTLGAKNALYDSYIRSIRWASDRIGESGIIGFVTNASFIRSEAAAGVRACLQQEFTDIWVFDLRGDGRRTGDGRNIFEYPGQGSGGTRTPVAIFILVKNPNKKKHVIHYSVLEDEYYSGQDKRDRVKQLNSIKGIAQWQVIKPDKHHDWLDQRTGEFSIYLPMGSKDTKKGIGNAIFKTYANGVKTKRDVWVYNSSIKQLSDNVTRHIEYCNSQDLDSPIIDPKQAKWSGELSTALKRHGEQKFDKNKIRPALYRPFFKQYLYLDKVFNQTPNLGYVAFPCSNTKNPTILVPDKAKKFSTLLTNTTPDLHIIAQNQCFPFKTNNENLVREREARNLCIIVPYKIQGEFSVFITDITPDLEVVHHGQVFPMKVME